MKSQNLSHLLHTIATEHDEEHVPIRTLVTEFNQRGFGVLLMLFSAIPALPLPAPPGITTLLALPTLCLAIQMLLGKRTPWLPETVLRKTIRRNLLIKTAEKLEPWLQKLEVILRPRFLYMTTRTGEKLIGLMCLFCGISVAMPFPFSNTVPSIGIMLMAAGMLERDGLAVKGGMVVGTIGIGIAITVMLVGVEAVKAIFNG